jgi:hypothetical protein
MVAVAHCNGANAGYVGFSNRDCHGPLANDLT